MAHSIREPPVDNHITGIRVLQIKKLRLREAGELTKGQAKRHAREVPKIVLPWLTKSIFFQIHSHPSQPALRVSSFSFALTPNFTIGTKNFVWTYSSHEYHPKGKPQVCNRKWQVLREHSLQSPPQLREARPDRNLYPHSKSSPTSMAVWSEGPGLGGEPSSAVCYRSHGLSSHLTETKLAFTMCFHLARKATGHKPISWGLDSSVDDIVFFWSLVRVAFGPMTSRWENGHSPKLSQTLFVFLISSLSYGAPALLILPAS